MRRLKCSNENFTVQHCSLGVFAHDDDESDKFRTISTISCGRTTIGSYSGDEVQRQSKRFQPSNELSTMPYDNASGMSGLECKLLRKKFSERHYPLGHGLEMQNMDRKYLNLGS